MIDPDGVARGFDEGVGFRHEIEDVSNKLQFNQTKQLAVAVCKLHIKEYFKEHFICCRLDITSCNEFKPRPGETGCLTDPAGALTIFTNKKRTNQIIRPATRPIPSLAEKLHYSQKLGLRIYRRPLTPQLFSNDMAWASLLLVGLVASCHKSFKFSLSIDISLLSHGNEKN